MKREIWTVGHEQPETMGLPVLFTFLVVGRVVGS